MYKLNLPYLSERIRGFTLSDDGVMCVFDYDEVFRIKLSDSFLAVEVLDDNPYDFEEQNLDFFGVSDRKPICQLGDFKLSYQFNPYADFQDVILQSPEQCETQRFRTFSGDWFVATFSPCGKYLVMAEPYLIEVYLLQ
jgi:hypothetical protein